jgi:Flp pilus assembly protein TadD
LAVSHGKAGDVLSAQGKLAEALEAYGQGQTIFERLAEQEPSNAGWHQDLALSYENLGNTLGVQGNLQEALEAYDPAKTKVRSRH